MKTINDVDGRKMSDRDKMIELLMNIPEPLIAKNANGGRMNKLNCLRRYQRTKLEREMLQRELAEQMANAETVTDVVQASLREHPYTRAHVQIEGLDLNTQKQEQIRQLRSRIREKTNKLSEAEEIVCTVDDPLVRACAEMHYLLGRTWRQTAMTIYKTPSAADAIRKMVNRYFGG